MRLSLRTLVLCIALLLVFLSPTALSASEGGASGEAGIDWLLWTAKLLNFGIFAGALIYFIVPPVKQMLDGRQSAIAEELGQAEQSLGGVARKKAEAVAELKRLEAQAAAIRVRAKDEAEAERTRILEETQRSSERLVQISEARIEGAMRTARAELRQFAAELSVQLAEELVRKEINEKDQEILFDEGIRSLEAGV